MTEWTHIRRVAKGFTVEAAGGYDGYIIRDFDTIEEALEYVSELWKF